MEKQMSEDFKDILSIGLYFTVVLIGVAGGMVLLDLKESALIVYYIACFFLVGTVIFIIGNWFKEGFTFDERENRQKITNRKARMQSYGKPQPIE